MNGNRALIITLGSFVITIIGAFFFYILCLNHVSPQKIGITYDSLSGEINVQRHPGWYVTSPFVQESTITTLPMQVCIYAGRRLGTCKLVRFNPSDEGIRDFLADQGFHYWEAEYPTNCNSPTNDCTGFAAIMRGYAFSGQEKTFITVEKSEN